VLKKWFVHLGVHIPGYVLRKTISERFKASFARKKLQQSGKNFRFRHETNQ